MSTEPVPLISGSSAMNLDSLFCHFLGATRANAHFDGL